MKKFSIGDEYYFRAASTTKGTQPKYFKDGYFYKVNRHGNEGFTEFLVSLLLKHSTVPRDLVVSYEYCQVNGRGGCRAKNFLLPGEKLYTMNAMHLVLTGKPNLADELAMLQDAGKRLEYVLDIVEQFKVPRAGYRNYLRMLMQLDMLIENCDRHVHNYGVIFSDTGFRQPPIFDNGMSLRTNGVQHPAACTLSGSFMEQVVVFGFPVKPAFLVDYHSLFRDLKRIEEKYGTLPELGVLKRNLKEHRDLFEGK